MVELQPVDGGGRGHMVGGANPSRLAAALLPPDAFIQPSVGIVLRF